VQVHRIAKREGGVADLLLDIERLDCVHFVRQLDRLGVHRNLPAAVRQPIAPLGFGAQVKLGPGPLSKDAGNTKEVRRAPFLQFEFEFRNGLRMTPGRQPAAIDRKLDLARPETERSYRTLNGGLGILLSFCGVMQRA